MLQCVVCPAPSARPPGAGPGAGGGRQCLLRTRPARGGPAGAAQSVSRPSRHCLSALRDHTEHTVSSLQSVQSTVQRVQSVDCHSPQSSRQSEIGYAHGYAYRGGRYYQYGVAVWVHHLYGRWRARGGFGGVRGCGGPTWRPPSPRRPCLGVATLQRGAYKTWNTSLRTSQTIVTSSPAPGAPATQGGADTAPPVSTTVQLYPTCAVERRAEIGQPGPTRPVHGQAYPDRLYCAHSLAMHRLWTKQKVSAQSMMPSVRNMVKVCCGRLSPV